MDQLGWIKLHRRIQHNWLWDEKPFSKLQAWIDLIMLANRKEKARVHNEELVIVKRGDHLTTLRTLGERWGWSKNKVRHFLKMLESDTMIHTDSARGYTHLTICNYGRYQDKRDNEGTAEGHGRDSQGTAEGLPIEGKEVKEGGEESARAREESPFPDAKTLQDLKNKYSTIDVGRSLRKYLDHRKSKGLDIDLKSLTYWLDRDLKEGWNIKAPSEIVTLYCPGGHEKRSVTRLAAHKGVFCLVKGCEAQLVEPYLVPIINHEARVVNGSVILQGGEKHQVAAIQ